MNKCRVWKQIQRCTKSELLYIIENLCSSAPSALAAENAYADIEREREIKQMTVKQTDLDKRPGAGLF